MIIHARWKFLDILISLQMMDVFTRASEALFAVHGTVFLVGNTHDILYPNSGSARDWCKGVAGVKYTTGIELRDEGQFGFLLPENQGNGV